MDTERTWTELTGDLREIARISGAAAVLSWDQQTCMPKGAARLRGEQLATLSKLVHERATHPRMGERLEALAAADLDPQRARAVELLRRDHARTVKLPTDLVERSAKARSDGFTAWIDAKATADFSTFAPHLQRLLDLALETSAAIDPSAHPLQVQMERFDPGIAIPDLQRTFARLQQGLTELIGAAADRPGPAPLGGRWPKAAQAALHTELAAALGYDLNTGRLDEAEHPFTTSFGHGDVRITTHYHEDDLLNGLGSTVHETGHALYEQGLPAELAGTGLDEAASLGLHESQSRFWENAIGRSLPFFRWLKPRLDAHFPGNGLTPEALYGAANRIEPGLIRVRADEVTYNLHVIVRFELEQALFEGRLAVADLPAAWNERYARYLGVTPANDAEGVLQDVHWSGGAFAYFQSYTLGNLYAASFNAALREALPDLDARVEAGDFAPILGWLREQIHRHGRLLDGADRVRAVVGERDHVADLLGYLRGRHGALYGL